MIAIIVIGCWAYLSSRLSTASNILIHKFKTEPDEWKIDGQYLYSNKFDIKFYVADGFMGFRPAGETKISFKIIERYRVWLEAKNLISYHFITKLQGWQND